jgi:hypothetical protein
MGLVSFGPIVGRTKGFFLKVCESLDVKNHTVYHGLMSKPRDRILHSDRAGFNTSLVFSQIQNYMNWTKDLAISV